MARSSPVGAAVERDRHDDGRLRVAAPSDDAAAERERWHGARERVVEQHTRCDDAHAARCLSSSEKPFSRSAPPQKRQRAPSLAADESAVLLVVAQLATAVRAASKKQAPAIVTTVPPRTSPTAGVPAARTSAGSVWYANATSPAAPSEQASSPCSRAGRAARRRRRRRCRRRCAGSLSARRAPSFRCGRSSPCGSRWRAAREKRNRARRGRTRSGRRPRRSADRRATCQRRSRAARAACRRRAGPRAVQPSRPAGRRTSEAESPFAVPIQLTPLLAKTHAAATLGRRGAAGGGYSASLTETRRAATTALAVPATTSAASSASNRLRSCDVGATPGVGGADGGRARRKLECRRRESRVRACIVAERERS